MSALAFEEVSGFAPFGMSQGASDVAKRSERVTRNVFHQVKLTPVSALGPVVGDLFTLAIEDNVDAAVLNKAIKFARLLPADVRLPEVSADPDGEIAFDWGSAKGIVSVSIGATGRIVYAAELDGESISGTAQLGSEVPGAIKASLASFRSR